MPFYEYECQACKFYCEVMQKISDAPLVKCPSCGKRALQKLVSAPVFRLKGGGWYETDFKSDKEGRRNLLGSEKDEPAAKAEPPAADKAPGKDAPAAKEAPAVKAEPAKGAGEGARKRARRSPAPKARRGRRAAKPRGGRRR